MSQATHCRNGIESRKIVNLPSPCIINSAKTDRLKKGLLHEYEQGRTERKLEIARRESGMITIQDSAADSLKEMRVKAEVKEKPSTAVQQCQ